MSETFKKNLLSLSKNTSYETERRFLTESEREERRVIQKQMLQKIREISISNTQGDSHHPFMRDS